MYYITILDFANGSVDQYNLGQIEADNIENWQTEDFEDFLISEGYSLKNIEWMSHSDNTINYF
jgi:hypothetical protein